MAISYTLSGDTVFVLDLATKAVSQHSSDTPFYEYKVVQRTVEVGPKQDGYVGILSGLTEGDVVVTSNQHQLKNGGLVLVNNQRPLVTDTKKSN